MTFAKESALTFLYADEIKYHQFIYLVESGTASDVATDGGAYPSAVSIRAEILDSVKYFIAAAGYDALCTVLDCIPDEEFLCVTHDPWICDLLSRRFELSRRPSFMRMVTSAECFTPKPHPDVVKFSREIKAAVAESKVFGKRSPSEAVKFLSRYPAAFVAVGEGRIIARAVLARRSKRVFEVCGVLVEDGFRRRGLGAGVVSAAVRWILDKGGVPCYSARPENAPSVRLANALGFSCIVSDLRHLARPRRSKGGSPSNQ